MNSPFAKKALGQNFLVDRNAIGMIVDSIPSSTDLLLEIGPGRGALSFEIYPKAKRFCLLEKDDHLAFKIGEELAARGSKSHQVFHADALEFDWAKLWTSANPPLALNTKLTVLANLPYNVATEILFRLLEISPRMERMVLMFQKEVGERIASPPGGSKYGIISVLVQNFFRVQVQQLIKPGSFRPIPKVDSVVLEFYPLAKPVLVFPSAGEWERFQNLVRCSFGHKRKTLLNSLQQTLGRLQWHLPKGKADIQNALESCGIELKRRAETLNLQEYGILFQYVEKHFAVKGAEAKGSS